LRRRFIGIANGAFAAASYGTNPLFALPLYSMGMGVNSVLFYRYAIAVVFYWFWLVFVKKVSLKIGFNEFLPLMFMGILFSLSSLSLFDSFQYIEAGIACTILFIYPLIVALIMAVFYKERITKSVICAIFMTSLGIYLLYNTSSSTFNFKGIILVLFSALSYALYIVGVKKMGAIRHLRSEKLSFYVMLFGLLLYIYNLKFCTQLQVIHSPFLWLCTVALSVLPTIVSIETITVAIKLIGSTSTAILGALEPLTAIFFGVIFFHEKLTFRICCGILLIILGVMFVILKDKIAKFHPFGGKMGSSKNCIKAIIKKS